MTTDLPAQTELLVAAHLFAVDPRSDAARARLAAAAELAVEGALYCQLRDACARVLKAPARDLSLAAAAIGDLVIAAGGSAVERPAPVRPLAEPRDVSLRHRADIDD